MCALGVPISRTALTYLYNACANAKPVDGQMAIACAEEVRAATAKRGYQPERIHFCTLIKLYARLVVTACVHAYIESPRSSDMALTNKPNAFLCK